MKQAAKQWMPEKYVCTCIDYSCGKCRALFPNGWMSKDFCCRCQLDDINPDDCPCVVRYELSERKSHLEEAVDV